MVTGVASSLLSQTLSARESQISLYWKTSQDCSTATKGKISEVSLERWMNSGMSARGAFSMFNISERPREDAESSLSQVLETLVPLKYFLTPTQLSLYLERAQAQRNPMPEDMIKAMQNQITYLSNMDALEGVPGAGRKARDGAGTAKRGRSIHAGQQMLFARRLIPSECETLQGFPKGWTEADTGQ